MFFFSDAGIGLSEPASEIPIGDLFIASGKFEGLTVNEFLEIAEKVLGGDTSDLGGFSATISDVNEAASSINENFVDCQTDGGFLEIRECPVPKGSITVCKIIIDPDRNVVNGSDIPGSEFSISGFSPETSQPDAVGEIGTTEWVTPLSFNANLLGDDEIDDAECTTYSDLEIGGYFYTNETFPAEGWEDPLYNDQHKTAVSTLDDFFPYDDKLFDEDPGNDGERDTNVDGHITLTDKRRHRTLVVLNQYKTLPFCGDGKVDEGEQCDDGNNLNGDGCSATCTIEGSITVCKIIIDPDRNVVDGSDVPGSEFSISGFTPDETSQPDPVGEIGTTEWETPLSFNSDLLGDDEINDAECVTYSNLEIGGYFYTNETFPSEGWEDPLYNDQHKTAVSTLDDFFPYDDKLFDEAPDPVKLITIFVAE